MVRRNKVFTYEVTIDPLSYQYYDFGGNPSTDDYTPFHNFTVINQGGADIKIYINNEKGYYYIPSGTILEKQDLRIYNIKLVNEDSVNSANVKLTVDNDYSEKELLKILALSQSEK